MYGLIDRTLSWGTIWGWKASGIEEECFEELMSYTQIKNVNMLVKKFKTNLICLI